MEECLKEGTVLCEAKSIHMSYHPGSRRTTLKWSLSFTSPSVRDKIGNHCGWQG